MAKVRTIDITWKGVLPLLLLAYRDGTPKGQRMAVEELTRMAVLADEHAAERADRLRALG